MKRLRTPLISVLLLLLLVLPLAPAFDAETSGLINDCGLVRGVFAGSDENFYILSENEGNYRITEVNSAGEVSYFETDIAAFATPYAYYGDQFFFFINGGEIVNSEPFLYVTVKLYDCTTGAVRTRIINDEQPRQDCTFAFDGERLYLMTPSKIRIYNDKYHLEDEFYLESKGYSLTAGEDGTVYCACSNGVIVIGGGRTLRPIETENVYPFGDYFSDDNSVIYDKTGGAVIFDGFDPSRGTAALGSYFIGNRAGRLTAAMGGELTDLGEACEGSFICGSGGVCGCFEQSGVSVSYHLYTLSDIEKHTAPADAAGTSVTINDDYTITGISPGTTAAALRKEQGFDGAVFYKTNGELYESGKLGTGMTVQLQSGTYTVVIFGELTGEGNINSRDLTAIEDHLIGVAILDGPYLKAADLNHDGTADLKDAVALNRYNNGKSSIEQ